VRAAARARLHRVALRRLRMVRAQRRGQM
jgi:hypothetical protein